MQQATWQYLCREFGSPQPAEIHLLLSLRCFKLLGNISAKIYNFEQKNVILNNQYYLEHIY
jgi:hypothetical protein